MATEGFFSITGIFRDRRRFRIFSICLALSVFLWGLLSLGKTYEARLRLNLILSELSNDEIELVSAPKRLDATVEGSGFDLIRAKWILASNGLEFSANELNWSAAAGPRFARLEANALQQALMELLEKQVKVLALSPSPITFGVDDRATKTMEVRLADEFSFADGFAANNSVQISPATIEVEGSAAALAQSEVVWVRSGAFKKLKGSVDAEFGVDLEPFGRGARAVPAAVRIEVSVEPTQTVKMMWPLEIDGVEESIPIEPIELLVTGTESAIAALDSSFIQVHVLVKTARNGKAQIVIEAAPHLKVSAVADSIEWRPQRLW